MRLRDVLLVQPDASADATTSPQPWFAPPLLAKPNQATIEGTWDTRSPYEVATYIKAGFLPAPQPSKRAQELQWVTTTLTATPADDTFPRYKG